jgi:hypothetical protein
MYVQVLELDEQQNIVRTSEFEIDNVYEKEQERLGKHLDELQETMGWITIAKKSGHRFRTPRDKHYCTIHD